MNNQKHKTPTRTVVAAAIVNDPQNPTKILAAARAYPPQLAGKYEFPGGKIEPGESAQQALTREPQEELQIDVKIGPEIRPQTDQHASREQYWPILANMQMRVFLAALAPSGQVPAPTGSHKALNWVNKAQTFALDWLEPDLPIAKAVWQKIETWATSPNKFF